MKFSIIIPIYNSQRYLDKIISSVIKQTYKDWELILVNDGSKDASGNICNYYAQLHDNIFAYHIRNVGPSTARNIGIEKAKGEYCIFLDSDDLLDTKALEEFFIILSKKSYDLMVFGYNQMKYNKNKLEVMREAKIEQKEYCSSAEFSSDYLLFEKAGYTHPVWNKVYKTELLNRNGIFFPTGINISEDFIFNLQVYRLVKSVYILPKILYYYISYNKGTITTTFDIKKIDNIFTVYKQTYKIMEEWQPKYTYILQNELITNISVFINSMFNTEANLNYSEKLLLSKKIISKVNKLETLNEVKLSSMRNYIIVALIRLNMGRTLLLTGRISKKIKRIKIKKEIHNKE